MNQAVTVDPGVFDELAPLPPETRVIAIAARPEVAADALLVRPRQGPLVLLERPAHLGNAGAVIRVAAAAGASGVITTGPQDPWHPAAIRGAAGLQFALPVARAEDISRIKGPVVGLHPEGEPLSINAIPSDAVLVFGSERRGLSAEMLSRVDRRIAIPMQPGVSSLNLATAVAVVLYAWRLGQGEPDQTVAPGL